MTTQPSPEEIEIAVTECLLTDAREELERLIALMWATSIIFDLTQKDKDIYSRWLRKVHDFEEYGQRLDPTNLNFRPLPPLE